MDHFTVLLTAAAVAFGLSRLLRLSPIPLLILSGIALRAFSEYTNIKAPEMLLGEMIEIGLAVLVFTSGVDLSPQRMRGNTRNVLIVAVVQFVILGIAGTGTALFLHYNFTDSLYLGFALSASSTLIVVKQLQKRQKMFVPFGRLVLGVLLIQDIFIILLMVVLLKSPDGILAIIGGISGTVALGLVAIIVHKRFIPWATTYLQLDEEELMLGALSMLFAFSGVAYLMNLPFLVGAFFAGFALSAFPMNGLVRGMLSSLSGFFLAIFFISIGTVMILPDLLLIQHSLVFIIVLVLVTIILVSVVSELVGYSTRTSIEASLILSQTSEFSLLLAYSGMASGLIPARLFSVIVLITVSTMTLTPFVARKNVSRMLMKLHPRYRRGETDFSDYADHAVMLGFGRAGAKTLQLLKEKNIDVVVIEEDAALIRQLIEKGIACIQGSSSNKALLKQANCKQARMVICAMKNSEDAFQLLEYLERRPVKVIVNTFEHSETESIQRAGGYPVQTALASAQKFIEWLDANTTNPDISKESEISLAKRNPDLAKAHTQLNN